jgi:shingomyelin synthase
MYSSSANKTGLCDPEIHESGQVSATSIIETQKEQSNVPNRIENTRINKNHTSELKEEHAANLVSTSSSNMPSTIGSQEHKQNRIQQAGDYSQNPNNTNNILAGSPENDPDILDKSNSSKYCRIFTMTSGGGGGTGVRYKGHRRNISNMSNKPLITSDDYSSTSDISEDGDGSNRTRHTHQRDKSHHRSMVGDQCSSSCHDTSGDRNEELSLFVKSLRRDKNGNRDTTSHIIGMDDDGEEARCSNNKEDEYIPREPLKTFVASIFLFMAFVATTASLAFVHDRVPFDNDPLPDLFLDNVKYQHWGLDASEILLMILVWTAILITIFHKHRFIVYRRIFLLGGLHYFYRAITMVVTTLPVADKIYQEEICRPQSNQTTAFVIGQRVLKLISGMGLSINGQHVYCGDYIYSGHTMSLIMAYLIIKEYSPRRWVLLHYAAMVLAIGGVVTLLIARGHYSIDVVIAYWITTRIWWIFHTLADNANLKEVDGYGRNQNNYLKNLWWWYIFRWFECNVPICLPRRFNLPIPDLIVKSKLVQYVYLNLRRRITGKQPFTSSTPENCESNVPPPSSDDRTKEQNDLTNIAAIV